MLTTLDGVQSLAMKKHRLLSNVQVWLAYVDYTRRRTEFGNEDAPSITQCLGLVGVC